MAPSKVCALGFDCRAAISKFLCARAQFARAPRPYKYLSPSATSWSSGLIEGTDGCALGMADFRIGTTGATGASLGAEDSAVSVSSSSGDAVDGCAADSPEPESLFRSGVWASGVWSGDFAAAGAGSEGAALPLADPVGVGGATCPVAVVDCASGGKEITGGSGVVTGPGAGAGDALAGALLAVCLGINPAQG
jgi:hypothetical protein